MEGLLGRGGESREEIHDSGLRLRKSRTGLDLGSQQRRGGKQAGGSSWDAGRRNVSGHPPLPLPRSHLKLSFTNFCPFALMRLRDLPDQKIYTRQELYRAQPPRVLEPSGFHTENSLAVYQGLVYYLLWLHSKYHKVGAWGRGCPRRGFERNCGGPEGQVCGAGRTAAGVEQSGTAWYLRLSGDWEMAFRLCRGAGCRAGQVIFCFGLGAGTEAGQGSGNVGCLWTLRSAPSRCWRSLQPYADPVHDSTWRWWKNKKQDQVRGEGCELEEG